MRESGAATGIGQNYLEQGRYAEAIVSTGEEKDLVDRTAPKIVFQNASINLPVSKSADLDVKNLSKTPFVFMQRGRRRCLITTTTATWIPHRLTVMPR